MSFRLLTSHNHYLTRIYTNISFTEIFAWTKMSDSLKADIALPFNQMNTKLIFKNS